MTPLRCRGDYSDPKSILLDVVNDAVVSSEGDKTSNNPETLVKAQPTRKEVDRIAAMVGEAFNLYGNRKTSAKEVRLKELLQNCTNWILFQMVSSERVMFA